MKLRGSDTVPEELPAEVVSVSPACLCVKHEIIPA